MKKSDKICQIKLRIANEPQSFRLEIFAATSAIAPRKIKPQGKGEFALALMPTLVILAVLALVEVLSRQRLLFASLASSAFLIYLDPQHGTNTVKTLVISQILAASIGLLTFVTLGSGYLSGGSAMVLTIVSMILLDAVHPPAVATSLSFALRAGKETNLILFAMAVGITAMLVLLEKCALWLLTKHSRHSD